MKSNYILLFFFFVAAPLIISAQKPAHKIEVSIINLRSDDGQVFIALQSPDQKVVQQRALTVKNRQVTIRFEGVKAGKYAIRLFHDENNNKIMDKNSFGAPTESWGFSNNVKALFGPPEFHKMLFEVTKDKKITIEMQSI